MLSRKLSLNTFGCKCTSLAAVFILPLTRMSVIYPLVKEFFIISKYPCGLFLGLFTIRKDTSGLNPLSVSSVNNGASACANSVTLSESILIASSCPLAKKSAAVPPACKCSSNCLPTPVNTSSLATALPPAPTPLDAMRKGSVFAIAYRLEVKPIQALKPCLGSNSISLSCSCSSSSTFCLATS